MKEVFVLAARPEASKTESLILPKCHMYVDHFLFIDSKYFPSIYTNVCSYK